MTIGEHHRTLHIAEHSLIETPADNRIELRQDDLHIERWHVTGHLDDPANGVRILHVPSQIVEWGSERVSFEENLDSAIEKLLARLAENQKGRAARD